MFTHVVLFGSTVAVDGMVRLNGELAAHQVPYISAAADWTGAVAADDAVEVPAVFVAMTLTRRVDDASLVTGTYVAAFAPAIALHAPPEESQCVH
jgi:hypothetical protein